MALKNLFDMVKADRYTADGREAIIKAQEAETEDKVYQIGEISQKTGLQKTANGWVKPKSGKQPGAASKHDTDPQTYIVKKNDELRKMYLNEKDPAKKEAMKKALKKQASMMEPEPFSSAESKPDESARIAASKEARAKKSQELGQKAAGDFAKYKDLPPAQRKDALGAASHEGISIGMTQRSMEGMGWDLIQADDEVNVYGKPDGSKAIMKHDGKKITEVSYEGPGEEPGPDRDDSPERAAYERELSRQQAQRAADDPRGFGYEEPPMEPAVESIGRDEKLNKVRQVLNTALTPSGDKVQMTKSKVTGDFHVLLNGKSTGGGFRDPQKAKEEFNAWIAGKKAPSESAKERINKRFDESEARSQKAMESKPAAASESRLPATPTRGMSEAYIRGTQLMKPAEDEKQRGEQQWAGVLSGYKDASVIEQRKKLQETYDEFEDDIKDYDRRGLAPAVYAKRINQQNFIKGALKAIDDEMESRGLDPAPNFSRPRDAAPRVLTGDTRIRVRKA